MYLNNVSCIGIFSVVYVRCRWQDVLTCSLHNIQYTYINIYINTCVRVIVIIIIILYYYYYPYLDVIVYYIYICWRPSVISDAAVRFIRYTRFDSLSSIILLLLFFYVVELEWPTVGIIIRRLWNWVKHYIIARTGKTRN